ncbi:hypothetical protein SBRY_20553 [Actinacidiphila bryophytorum]|uniref:Uncharacterized protein n=1 Tax=Actinacidiphila bryophytorum TaxID=1436133 RepID=A0A9W4GYA3_9ACTN|nr:hypothetical protein SBRY_20553 [Actinacidiphila bryophytorum]
MRSHLRDAPPDVAVRRPSALPAGPRRHGQAAVDRLGGRHGLRGRFRRVRTGPRGRRWLLRWRLLQLTGGGTVSGPRPGPP